MVERMFLDSVGYPQGVQIVSGGCSKGGDRFAELIAKKFIIPIKLYKPDWKRDKKSAGIIRDIGIAKASDILIACVSGDRKGGTEDCIKRFRKYHPNSAVRLV